MFKLLKEGDARIWEKKWKYEVKILPNYDKSNELYFGYFQPNPISLEYWNGKSFGFRNEEVGTSFQSLVISFE